MAQKSDTIPTGEKPAAAVPAAAATSAAVVASAVIGEVIYNDAIGRERLVQIARPDGARVRTECLLLTMKFPSPKDDWSTILDDYIGEKTPTHSASCSQGLYTFGSRCALITLQWEDWYC